MEKTNIKTETYQVNEDYLIDVVTLESSYEAWFYHKDYGIKYLIFDCSRELRSYEEVLHLVEAGDLEGHIQFYEDEYLQ